MPAFRDLTGKTFNRLTAIRRVENNKRGQVQWLCRCIEGNEVIVTAQQLTRTDNRATKSCGCPKTGKLSGWS
jgi:hypothetical protein